MRCARFVFLCCLVFICMPVESSAGQPLLRIAVETNYPPFSFVDGKGHLTGFDVDIARALCSEMKRECALVPKPFSAVLPAFGRGEIDMAVVGMGVSEERGQHVLFTDVYYQTRSIFIGKKAGTKDVSSTGLQGLRIGVKKDTLQEQYVAKTYGAASTVITAASILDVFGLLHANAADIILVDGLPGYTYLKTPEGAELEVVGKPVKLSDASACIAVSRELPELRDEADKALKVIQQNGVYKKIMYEYFDFPLYLPPMNQEQFYADEKK